MADDTNSFNETAKTLSRNPLGVIALFIVLVYAMATITLAASNGLEAYHRSVLVWFLVLFPVAVLTAFVFLVGWRNRTLYAPSDFADQKDWLKLMQDAVTIATSTGNDDPGADQTVSAQMAPAVADAGNAVKAVRRASERNWIRDSDKQKHILWVDDRPQSVAAVQSVFENYNMRVTNALDTDHALALMATRKFDAIISDMSRGDDKDAGHTLLKKLRGEGDRTPYYIFSTRSAAARDGETKALGGNGNTNDAADLLRKLTDALS